MARIIERAGRAAKRGIDDVEARVRSALGKRASRAKVAKAKRVMGKAVKVGLIGAAVATAVVAVREGRKRYKAAH